jgi:hypothetical protein
MESKSMPDRRGTLSMRALANCTAGCRTRSHPHVALRTAFRSADPRLDPSEQGSAGSPAAQLEVRRRSSAANADRIIFCTGKAKF